jgi:predicted DNA-binding WGR domain protein
MPTEETEFCLYLGKISEQTLKNFVRDFEQKHNNIRIEINKVNAKDEFFQQPENIIVSELGEIPSWQLVLQTSVEDIAYEAYCLFMNQSWHACLFAPKAEAVFVSFEAGLLARKVAHLWHKEGTSDKVYHLYLTYNPSAKFYTVLSRYGRRNGVLRQMEKAFDLRQQEAEKEWQRLFNEKIRKGYKLHKTIQVIQLEFQF